MALFRGGWVYVCHIVVLRLLAKAWLRRLFVIGYLLILNIRAIAIGGIWAILIGYLAFVNFHLPYMTGDEWRSVSHLPGEQFSDLVSSGRPSQFLSFISTPLLFVNPTPIELIPRFVTMMSVAVLVALLARVFEFSVLGSTVIAACVLLGHELDWQHNGLVAFFGSYNLYFILFFGAIYIKHNFALTAPVYTVVFLCVLFSFSTELFVALAMFYVVGRLVVSRQLIKMVIMREPFFHAILAYAVFFACVYPFSFGANHHAMETYLVGSVKQHSFLDICRIGLLSFVNSIPFFDRIGFGDQTQIIVASIMVLLSTGLVTAIIVIKIKSRQSWDGIRGGQVLLLGTLLACALAPHFMLALQPMKYEWIANGESRRYVFSFYSWVTIFLFFIGGVRRIVRRYTSSTRSSKYVFGRLVLFSVFIFSLADSVGSNVVFVNKYHKSLERWREINALAGDSRGVVRLTPDLLDHPYLSAISVGEVKKYIYVNYGRSAVVCYDAHTIDFSIQNISPMVQLDGFRGPELNGQWTNKERASILIKTPLKAAEKFTIQIWDVISPTKVQPLVLTFDGKTHEVMARPGERVLLSSSRATPDGRISVYVPALSDKELEQVPENARDLGVMIKSITIAGAAAERCF